eukprot:scpid105960/ scgid21534/ 
MHCHIFSSAMNEKTVERLTEQLFIWERTNNVHRYVLVHLVCSAGLRYGQDKNENDARTRVAATACTGNVCTNNYNIATALSVDGRYNTIYSYENISPTHSQSLARTHADTHTHTRTCTRTHTHT